MFRLAGVRAFCFSLPWNALERYREAMKRIPENLTTILEEAHPKIGKIQRIKELPHTNINSVNYLLKTKKGKFVLKHDRVTKHASLENMARVLAFCAKQGARVTVPVKMKSGKYAGRNGFILYRFVKGKPFSGNALQRNAVAKELAKLHLALAKYPAPFPSRRPYARLYRPLSPKELKKMPILFQISRELKKARFPHKQPQLIHGDIQPGNVLFRKNQVACILDFGGMHRGLKMRELGFAAFRFALASSSTASTLKQQVMRFAKAYGASHVSFEELRLQFLAETFARVSYILSQQKETGKSAWARDLKKHLRFLRLIS